MPNCLSESCITPCFHNTAETLHFPITHPQFGGKFCYLSSFSLNFGNSHGEKLYSIINLVSFLFATNQVPHFFLIFCNLSFFLFLMANLYFFFFFSLSVDVFYLFISLFFVPLFTSLFSSIWVSHILFLF